MNFHLLLTSSVRLQQSGPSRSSAPTILNVFSSSLICCASIGVRRLHVAISERRSYSWPVHVSWNTILGLNVAFRLPCPEGVPGALFESWRSLKAVMK